MVTFEKFTRRHRETVWRSNPHTHVHTQNETKQNREGMKDREILRGPNRTHNGQGLDLNR